MSSIVQRPLFALLDESLILNLIRYLGSTVGLFTNLFLIFIVLYSKNLRKCQYSWYMILLAFADILIAIGHFIRTIYISYTSFKGILIYSRLICVWINTPMGMGFTGTRIAVLAIAADRCYMVVRPLKYNSNMNLKIIFIIFSLQLIFIAIDSFTKIYGGDNTTPLTFCSMGTAQGPIANLYGQFYSNIIYIPFLIIYRKRNSSQISKSYYWKRQLEVTSTTFWLLFLYAFLWGGSYGSLLYANFTDNPKIQLVHQQVSFYVLKQKNNYKKIKTKIFCGIFLQNNNNIKSTNSINSFTHNNIKVTKTLQHREIDTLIFKINYVKITKC
ncbi:G_PROTEIN_RECEP_F1_2 domain-containing protein [Meloidogyne graminicola]|uniref:G_PROTEIN_RECEP_F1_2 domain-containing protein n=1 Tax=Meloidogyne graminicola TaxID=189291 RepID=A0A8S9ZC52_9BILA|nr:G_PROTEIN_RECEP_F1_2 domain-containing protein [Meloidogyne graminicola]